MRRGLLILACVLVVALMVCGVAKAATCEINGGAGYTNSTVVTVHYTASGWQEAFYRISDVDNFTNPDLTPWYPVDADNPYIEWTFDFPTTHESVFMQFAGEDKWYTISECQDSIILDQDAPSIGAFSVSVRRGHVCYLPFAMSDITSPKCQDTLWITTKGGKLKKRFVDGFRKTGKRWYWRYRCRLPKGRYHIRCTCVDMAGNVASYHRGAWLRVK